MSQYNQTVGQMQLNNFINYLRTVGFGYFKMNQDISNNQAFVLECSTDVPTIHTSECATNNLSKCYYNNQDGNYNASSTYEGGINFVCRNGYIEFVSNTCHLTTPTPPPDTGGGG